MFKVSWRNADSSVYYDSEGDAWRAVHELLEEAFGFEYGEAEIADYDVVAV